MLTKFKLFFLLFALIVTSSLSGCLTAGLGPKFTNPVTPQEGKAVIYLYRETVAMTGHEMPGVEMNDAVIAKVLPQVSYFPISVDPGSYTFTPKLLGIYKTTPATIKAEAGQTYFVRFRVLFGHLEFTRMDRDEAMAYMATCYLLNPGYATDSRVLSGEAARPATSTEPVSAAPATKQVVTEPAQVKPVAVEQKPAKARLYIDTVPADARVRIMNIVPKFEQGIELDGGRYHVEVSAAGYQKYLQWVTLEKGELRHLPVALVPDAVEAPPVVMKQDVKPVEVKQEVAPVVKSVKQASVVPIKAPKNASAEEKRYAEQLNSGSAQSIRTAAKNIYYRHYKSSYLASVAEQSLLQNYSKNTRDSMHIDAMAWLCKALARTGDRRFVDTLQTVADNAPNRKLKKYAAQSLGMF